MPIVDDTFQFRQEPVQMEANNGIDSKPRVRGRGRRRLSDRTSALSTEHPDDPLEDTDVEQVLNVRVKERDNDAGRRSRLGNLFKEPASTAIKGLFNKEPAQELKETIKRPLTGLFRRPGSRAGSVNAPHKGVNADGGNANMEVLASNYLQGDRSMSPEIPHIDKRLVQESVAHAPNVSVNRVAAMYQLDALNAKNAFLAKLDDIDLSLLSRYLCSEEEVRDEKVAWTWDYVFASISTEMREEWALDEEQDDDNYDERNRNNRFSH
ncbi:Intraflagellar transport protein 43 -like protein [Toxocara canis]|uniref:Intraflagellar transport protein 43-like protein n=1 Tax=Toxocara canis TaxID=6265 RepID=A0A0B2VSP5_TOXCA|nr:Intraflagellar transport protein 43 -like protein [Toxocara canis]